MAKPDAEAEANAKANAGAIPAPLRALYLLGLAIGVFFIPGWQWVGMVAASQLLLWLGLGLGFGALARQLRKLAIFCTLIFVAYALVSEDPAVDRWQELALPFGLSIDVNVHGCFVGLAMVLRILAVVLASHVARAGDANALARGLRSLGMPRSAALALDATLVLLGGASGGGGGKGTGGGKGRGGGHGGGQGGGDGKGGGKSARGFWAGIKRLARGDVSVLADSLLRQVARAEDHVASQLADGADADESEALARKRRELARDVAVIAGISLTMLGIKALKLLPGLPFAPGHKGVILIPLYIVAGFMTRSRGGATLVGLTFGTTSFLLGDGRWGVFEIAKHVSPGILVDLFMPAMRAARASGRRWLWALFGMLIALGRFATITLIALSVQAPALVFAFLIPGLLIHGVFGLLSGLVTLPLLRALDTATTSAPSPDTSPSTSPHKIGTVAHPPHSRPKGTGKGSGTGGGKGGKHSKDPL